MFEFKGDIENITKQQFKLVSEVLEKHDYKGNHVLVQAVGKAGDNYGSYVKRFIVEFDNGKEFKMIAKIAPTIKMLREQRPIRDFFLTEILIYNELLPKMRELEKNFGVPEEERFKYLVCYGTLSDSLNEIILLDDLETQNFIMFNKMQPLSDEAVKIVLKNIAKFHSLSYVLKRNDPLTYDKFAAGLVNTLMNQENMTQMEMFFVEVLNGIKAIFDKEMYTNAISEILEHFRKTGLKILTADKGSKYCVVQHGDLWTNNVMFRMQGDRPVECTLIDYQLAKESLPVSDIHNLVFNCTDYDTRSKHYYQWIDFYHLELDRYLNYFGLKVNFIYPRDKLDADLKRYGKVCFGLSLIMINFLLRQTQEAPDLASLENMDLSELSQNFKVENLTAQTFEAIKKRVEGHIESCFEYGYLSDVRGNFN
ncbi:unnamed protein product [Parnassius apollo]|uniref:(apollo) hypothetical protein n=1 Tax=Parnassius apollo TaxID=110799 RepID=A0A8S3W3A9_PARAO|nr:unnamed protein product [Parnassius apollo]